MLCVYSEVVTHASEPRGSQTEAQQELMLGVNGGAQVAAGSWKWTMWTGLRGSIQRSAMATD